MDQEQLKVAYKMYPFLQDIDRKSQGELGEKIIFKKVANGEVIKTDTMDCPGFIIILKGKMKVEKMDQEGRIINLYEVCAGELCHESLSCYLKCERLHVTSYALTDLEIGMIPTQEFNKYLVKETTFWEYSYTQLYKKFSLLVVDKEQRIHFSIQERLMNILKSKGTTYIYMTHEQLALELGTAREVVTRNLKMLQEQGLLTLQRGKIKLNHTI